MDIILNSPGAVSRLALLILSAYLFNRIFSSPIKAKLNLPPPGPSFSEKREWFISKYMITYGCPFFKTTHATATFFECFSIIITYFDTSTYRTFFGGHLPLPSGISQFPGYIPILGLLISIVGGLLRISCYKALGDAFTLNITESSSKLVTSGPYSFVRHPSYLALFLNSAGISVYHLSPGSWLRESGILQHGVWRLTVGLFFTALYVGSISALLRTEDEDRLMKRMFGEEWEAWRKIVRYRMFPGLY